MKKLLSLFIAACLAFAAVTGCTTTKIQANVVGTVPAGTTTAEVKQAIIDAANVRGWVLSEKSANSFLAHHSRGEYSATVQIDYDKTRYVITYVDSTGFKTKEGKIDKHYNDWVTHLNNDIQNAILQQKNLRFSSSKKI